MRTVRPVAIPVNGRMPFVGQSVHRREDERLLLGKGQFVSDFALPGMLHAVFITSPIAHGRVRSIDFAAALQRPGVHLAMTGADVQALLPVSRAPGIAPPARFKSAVPHRIKSLSHPLLAVGKVRHVGEPVAVVLAETRRQAEDAADLVEVDYETLPAVVDVECALSADSPLVHEELNSNEVVWFSVTHGEPDNVFANAPHVIRRHFKHHRYAAMPIECRGIVAQYDLRTEAYVVWSNTQLVHAMRREIAHRLGVSESKVRCVALDVGGSFGVKGHVYPEDSLIPLLARVAGRPVSWIEERREHLAGSCHARDQHHEAEIAFDDTGRVLAVRDRFLMDGGAWNPTGMSVAYNTAAHFLGPYKIDHVAIEGRVVATNKAPNAPYRGAGRPEAVHAMERLMEMVARHLGIEPAEVRLRNMISHAEMPYRNGLIYRDGQPICYDSGDYPRTLAMALEKLGGVEAFRSRQQEARIQGRYLGLGIACYTEGTGVGPFEGARVQIDQSGKIVVYSGVAAQGQGMETVLAQIAADAWRVNPDDVVVKLGDTDNLSMGFGTIASRTTVTVAAAIHHASEELRRKVLTIAGDILECATADLELRDGAVGVVGVPGAQLTFAELARAARPGWDHQRPTGMEPGLQATYYYEPATVTWAHAVHAAIVEIDIDTGHTVIERYVVSHDCGVLVNPVLAEGQITGGVIQGIAGTLMEAIAYDEEGQLLSGTLMDYAMPVASNVPVIEIVHQQTPSPLNPLGVKGLGEGGAIAPPASICNAVSDALAQFGLEINATPVTPQCVLTAIGILREGAA